MIGQEYIQIDNMDNTNELINSLFNKDDQRAYKSLKQLISISEKSNEVYLFFDTFIEMIDNNNSYIRTRGLLLIAANAKWDTDNKVDEIIDKYLEHIRDEKPITARQCIKALPDIAKHKPDLIGYIRTALSKPNQTQYADSMQTLIDSDIRAALKIISEL